MKKNKDEMQIPGKMLIPCGLACKPEMVIGMFWKENKEDEEALFLCNECSLTQLRNMDPPLNKINDDWKMLHDELLERGYNIGPYWPKAPIQCDRCDLIIPSILGQA